MLPGDKCQKKKKTLHMNGIAKTWKQASSTKFAAYLFICSL